MRLVDIKFCERVILNDECIHVPDDFEPLVRSPKPGYQWIWRDFANAEYSEEPIQIDLQSQYEAAFQQVANTRESLYGQIVDRLNNEAKMIRRIEGNEAKAAEYEAQADAAYLKIRADNPWPEPPITE
ncbi:hypothetical protein DXJ57_11955 [Vibrio fluvialis]|nr:hypothetical protein [Vibrio fluvialis]